MIITRIKSSIALRKFYRLDKSINKLRIKSHINLKNDKTDTSKEEN